MGCRAITPALVSLAKGLEGEPFHLLAAHCQNNERESVVGYVRSQGMAEDSPNMTVSSFGGHPGVEGNGHVPYYMVFDHTGKLRHHHMCGNYHGGDGMKFKEWVEKLLAEAPRIDVGEAPYEHFKKVAAQIAAREKLSKAISALAKPASEAGAEAERTRLLGAVAAWRDKQVVQIERKLGTRPSTVVGDLLALAKELGSGELATRVKERAATLKKDPAYAGALKVEKVLMRTKAKLAKLKVPKAAKRRGIKVFDLDDAACRSEHTSTLKKAAKKLRETAAAHPGLAISKTAEAYAARMSQ